MAGARVLVVGVAAPGRAGAVLDGAVRPAKALPAPAPQPTAMVENFAFLPQNFTKIRGLKCFLKTFLFFEQRAGVCANVSASWFDTCMKKG